MSGKSKMGSSRADGKPTRTKIDLFPGVHPSFAADKARVWDAAGRVLRSKELEKAFVQRLAPGLERRFGENFAKVKMYPVPILTRDIPGYRIFKHTDSLWKGITVQFYLPPDNSTPHIGTIFHEVLPNGRKPKKAQMPFSPNTRLRVRRGRQHMAFGRPGRTGSENARQHSAHLFRRCRAMAICAQSRTASSEFCAQRAAQFEAPLGGIARGYVTTALYRHAARSNTPGAQRRSERLQLNEAMVVPCSPAHTQGLRRQQNFPPILSAQFCPACRLPCGDN